MLTRWEQLRGHEDQRQLFQRSVARGRLSHSYVLAGPSGIGKHQFARLLANHSSAEAGLRPNWLCVENAGPVADSKPVPGRIITKLDCWRGGVQS